MNATNDVTDSHPIGLIPRIVRSVRYRVGKRAGALRKAAGSALTDIIRATARGARHTRRLLSDRAESVAIATGTTLVRSGTDLMLFPHRAETIALPIPLEVGTHRFDVVADLEEYTGLPRSEVRALIERRIESFRTEWHSAPRPLRDDSWFYRASRLYLFANAIHVHDTPDVVDLVAGAAPAGGRILEFGGGTGNLTLALAARGFFVDYVELSALQKDFVRFRAARHGLEDRITILDAWSALPRDTYDLVCALDVFEHLPNLRETLEQRILPALKLSGALVEQSPFVVTASNPMHHLDEEGLDDILRRQGLRIMSDETLGRTWARDTRKSHDG